MNAPIKEPHVFPRSGEVKRLVVILHGYGADGDNLIGIAHMMAPAFPDTLWIAPDAPHPCEMGMGYQWFSLADRSTPARDKGVSGAAPQFIAYLEQLMQRYGLAADQVALMGFSQGTMMSLYCALRMPSPVAAVVGFSGALLGQSTMASEVRSRPAICLIHGTADEVVPFAALEDARAGLEANHITAQTHARRGLGHSIDEEGIEIAAAFLVNAFKL